MTEFLMARSATIIPDLGYLIRKLTGSGIGSASEFINELSKFINIFSTIYCICAVLVLCYFGYCAFRTILAIQGFVGGAAVGAVLGLAIAVTNRQFDSIGAFAIIGALIVGVVICVLANLLYKLGVFLFFSSNAFFIMFVTLSLGFGIDWGIGAIVGAIVGLIVGIIAVIVDKYFIIAGTATAGACIGGLMIMSVEPIPGLIVAAVLLVSGIIVQVKLTKKLADRKKGDKKNRNPSVQYQAPVVCPTCGTLNADPGMFCKNCGSRLPIPVPTTTAPSEPESRPAAPIETAPVYSAPDNSTAPVFSPDAALRCPACGNPGEPGEKFCSVCGKPFN